MDVNTGIFSTEQARNGGDAMSTVRPLKQGSKHSSVLTLQIPFSLTPRGPRGKN